MRAQEALDLAHGRRLLRANGGIFFICRNREEAEHFRVQGCTLTPFQPRAWSERELVWYEVSLLPLLDRFVVSDIFGGEKVEHVERDLLLAMLRERDGCAFAFQESL